jgi:excisionase family DNA binding protein
MAHQPRMPVPSKCDLDRLIADSSEVTRLPPESLASALAQVIARLAELKNLEGILLSILFNQRLVKDPSTEGDGRLLSAAEVAKLFDVPESWVREQARLGNLPSIRLGHYVRFKPNEIERFVAARDSTAA